MADESTSTSTPAAASSAPADGGSQSSSSAPSSPDVASQAGGGQTAPVSAADSGHQPDQGADAGQTADEGNSRGQVGDWQESLVDRAKACGISQSDLDRMGDHAETFLNAIERHIGRMAMGGSPSAGKPADAAADAIPGPAKDDDAGEPDAKPPADSPVDDPSGWQLDVEALARDYDEGLASTIKGMNEHYRARVSQLEGVIGQILGSFQQQHVAQQIGEFDSVLNSLGDEYQKHLGNGRVNELARVNKDAHAMRAQIWNEMVTISAAYQQTGRPVPPMSVLARRAADYVLGEKGADIAKDKAIKQISAARSQAIAKPNGRTGDIPVDDHSDAAARKAYREKMASLGIHV